MNPRRWVLEMRPGELNLPALLSARPLVEGVLARERDPRVKAELSAKRDALLMHIRICGGGERC